VGCDIQRIKKKMLTLATEMMMCDQPKGEIKANITTRNKKHFREGRQLASWEIKPICKNNGNGNKKTRRATANSEVSHPSSCFAYKSQRKGRNFSLV